MTGSTSYHRDISHLARRHRRHRTTHPWVSFTLFTIVGALIFGVIAVPRRELPKGLGGGPAYDLRLALGELRSAIAAYEADHGEWPGHQPGSAEQDCPVPSAEWFERQLTRETDGSGELSLENDPASSFGPYLRDSLPVNPINGLATVRMLAAHDLWPYRADGTTGWIYRPENGEVRANTEGTVFGTHARYYEL